MPHYAFNVADLTVLKRDAPLLVNVMIAPVISQQSPTLVKVGNNVDDYAVVTEDLPEERLNAIVQIIHKGMGQWRGYPQFRAYRQGPRGGWRKVE